jgi:hypothetical protein
MNPLAVQIAGVALESPLVLASGMLGTTASSLRRVAEAGAGAVTTKSCSLDAAQGASRSVHPAVEGRDAQRGGVVQSGRGGRGGRDRRIQADLRHAADRVDFRGQSRSFGNWRGSLRGRGRI